MRNAIERQTDKGLFLDASHTLKAAISVWTIFGERVLFGWVHFLAFLGLHLERQLGAETGWGLSCLHGMKNKNKTMPTALCIGVFCMLLLLFRSTKTVPAQPTARPETLCQQQEHESEGQLRGSWSAVVTGTGLGQL